MKKNNNAIQKLEEKVRLLEKENADVSKNC